MKIRKRNARPDVPGTFLIELGWNSLQDNLDEMDIIPFSSRTVNLYYFYNIPLGKGKFELMPGIGLGLDRYSFDDDITLSQSNTTGNVTITDLDFDNVQKTLLVSNYIDIPLELLFYSNPDDKRRSFKIGIGGKFGLKYSSHTKVKYDNEDGATVIEKDKRDFGLNPIRYGATGRIGLGGFSLFFYQSLSNLFEDGQGPMNTETRNLTIGLSFIGF